MLRRGIYNSSIVTRKPFMRFAGSLAKHQLTSKIIATTADGDYPWDAQALLAGHEMLRRELNRGTLALNNFKLIIRPWHAFCFHSWFEEFMAPCLKEHHETETNILFRSYTALQVHVPPIFVDDHKGLDTLVNDVLKTASDLNEATEEATQEGISKMNALEIELKAKYHKLVEFNVAHMAEEEKFWMQRMNSLGEQQFQKIQENIGHYVMTTYPDTYQQNMCATLTCMGIVIRDSNVKEEADWGWAGPALRQRHLGYFHQDVINAVLPEWNRYYTMKRLMIDGIVDEVDIKNIETKIEQLMSQQRNERMW